MGYRDDWLGTSEELSTTLPDGQVIRGSYNEPGYLEQAVDAISPMQNIRDTKTAYDEGRYWDAAGNAALVGATALPIGKGLSVAGQIAKPFIQKGAKALAPHIGKGVKAIGEGSKWAMDNVPKYAGRAIGKGSKKLWKGIKKLGEPDPSVVKRAPWVQPVYKPAPVYRPPSTYISPNYMGNNPIYGYGRPITPYVPPPPTGGDAAMGTLLALGGAYALK